MSAANANVFRSHWPFTGLIGSDSIDASSPRLEDLFDAWVFAARDAEVALSAWTSSKSGARADAHAVYRAALDREECAAAALATAAHSQCATTAGDDERATAYRRVIQALRNVGRAKLRPREEACIREAADALPFCTDTTKDRCALAALGALARLILSGTARAGSRNRFETAGSGWRCAATMSSIGSCCCRRAVRITLSVTCWVCAASSCGSRPSSCG